MRARALIVAFAALVLCVIPASGSQAAGPSEGAIVCTWGGTPTAPTGVFTASPGVTNTPSTGPIDFVATGELAGGEGCTGKLTFRGVLGPGTSCMVEAPFRAKAQGLPQVAWAEGSIGIAGTAPVLLYDSDGNVVGSEQAQFLSEAFKQSESAFWDCGTPEGLTRANWSDTVELLPTR
jgi:hypothetical protein